MKNISLFVFLVVAVSTNVMVGCASNKNSNPGFNSKEGTTTTIILTRHGDRDALSNILNEKGRLRADALVKAINGYNVTAIYCPDITRNITTAKPTAKHFGINIKTVGIEPVIDDVFSNILSKHSGEVVLWIGNTDNLLEIYYELGGKGEPPNTYGDLFTLEIKDKGYPNVMKKRYGPL